MTFAPPIVEPPRLCIIIPCFNHGAFLREALASALAIDQPGTEVVVVDDGSTDADTQACWAELERDPPPRVRLIRQANQGVCVARNRAIAATSAPYILSLDADNRVRPDYARAALAILEADPRVGVVYGGYQTFGLRSEEHPASPFDLLDMLLKNRIDNCAVYRRQVWVDVGGYDSGSFSAGYEDWDFWLGAWSKGWQFHALPGIHFDYRIQDGSMACRCNEPAVRRQLVGALAAKYRELYQQQWPEVWVRHELDLLRVERDLQRAESLVSSLRGRERDLEVWRDGLQREVEVLQQALAQTQAESKAQAVYWEGRVQQAEGILRDLAPVVALRARLLNTPLSRIFRFLRYRLWA